MCELLSQIGPTELLGPRSIEARRVLGQYEPPSLFSKSQTGKDDPNSHFENNLTSLLDETSQSGRKGGVQERKRSHCAFTYIDLELCAIRILNGGIIALDPLIVDELGCSRISFCAAKGRSDREGHPCVTLRMQRWDAKAQAQQANVEHGTRGGDRREHTYQLNNFYPRRL